MEIFISLLGYAVLIMGIWDAYKYKLMSNKMSKLKSAKEHSRTFLNGSIIFKFLFLLYAWLKLNDNIVMWTCAFALYTLVEAWHTMYIHYPYKRRGLKNFKRPSMWKYFINSLLPNQIRKKL